MGHLNDGEIRRIYIGGDLPRDLVGDFCMNLTHTQKKLINGIGFEAWVKGQRLFGGDEESPIIVDTYYSAVGYTVDIDARFFIELLKRLGLSFNFPGNLSWWTPDYSDIQRGRKGLDYNDYERYKYLASSLKDLKEAPLRMSKEDTMESRLVHHILSTGVADEYLNLSLLIKWHYNVFEGVLPPFRVV